VSGGSYDYAFRTVQDVASQIRSRHPDSPMHLAFAAHLELVAKAMHDVEWVDSCDYGRGDDVEAIRAVISPAAEVTAIAARAETIRAELESAIARSRDPR
jgi:hypothetical protein